MALRSEHRDGFCVDGPGGMGTGFFSRRREGCLAYAVCKQAACLFLGAGHQGLSDEESGLMTANTKIHSLNVGDVALLKGETWQDNEGKGLVHRSPALAAGEKRLLVTLDFIA